MAAKPEFKNQIFHRDVRLQASAIDEDSRTVRVSFSSEIEYTRTPWFGEPWVEILGHDAGEVDLSRLNGGASVHYNHSRSRGDRIGVVQRAWVENKRGHAIIKLSKRDDIDDIWTDLKDGLLRNVSAGYKINRAKLVQENADGPDVYRITSWEPAELSLVDIPADPTVGVGRSAGTGMPAHLSRHDRQAPDFLLLEDKNVDDDEKKAAIAEGQRLAQERMEDISNAFEHVAPSVETRALFDRAVRNPKLTVDDVRKELLKIIGRGTTPSGTPGGLAGEDIRAGIPQGLTFRDAAVDALLLRCGGKIEKPATYARDLQRLSLVEIARACLDQAGVNTTGYSSTVLISRAMTTSDFPKILANVGEKLVIEGFMNPERGTHRIWTGVASHRDFKETSSVAPSETPELEKIGEEGEFKFGKLEETGDKVALATYGKILGLSRQAIINDDLGALQEAARAFGDSALRLEANLCYAALTANPNMADGKALFHADHDNIGTAGAPSVTTLGEARQLMRVQKGLNGESYLDPQPYALIVPTALETASEQILASIFDPAGVNQQTASPEFIRRLVLVADPRLDADSDSKWYVTANPNVFGWIKRIYLDGQQTPYIEEREGFERDYWQIKCRHDFAVKAYLYQGAVSNAGGS